MLILFAVAAAAVTPTAVAVVPNAVPAVTSPDWLRKPVANDLVRYFPAEAARKGVNGRATISCKVDAAGLLVDCSVLSEEPVGEGFGAAALGMSALFKMRPMSKDGAPIAGGTVRIPIRFELPKRPPPTLDQATTCYGLAAADAERNPASPSAWTASVMWSNQVAARLEPGKIKPSELEAKLRTARESASTLLDTDIAKALRASCAAGAGSPSAGGSSSSEGSGKPFDDDPRLPSKTVEAVALVKRCYMLSVADAEKPDSTADSRGAYAMWRLLVEFLAVAPEAPRPSEYSARFAAYSRPPASPAERAEAEKAKALCPIVIQKFQPQFQKLLANLAKPQP